MRMQHRVNSLDRRLFLAGRRGVRGLPGAGKAQTVAAKELPRLSARIADFVTGFDLEAGAAARDRARAHGLRRYRRRDLGGLDGKGRRDRARHGAGGGRGAGGVGDRLAAEDLAAARGAGQRRRLACARFRFHLHAGPADGAGDPGAAAARRADRRDARGDAGGVHRRLRGLLAARAAPTRRTTARGSWHGTSTIGAISAAVACARLMKVPAAAIPT